MSGKALAWGALLVSLVLASRTGVAEEKESATLLRDRLRPYEREGDRAVEESIMREIGFLTFTWLEGEGREYYEGLMTRWEKCATERSLPVLERFIKGAAARKRPGLPASLAWNVFGPLDERIQELWFDLKTKDMTPQEKAELALWGLSGEWPNSPLNWEHAVSWLPRLGPQVRPVVYAFLERSSDKTWDDLKVGALCGPVVVARDRSFRPTEQECARFLSLRGTLGHLVILDYLVTWQVRLPECVGPMKQLLTSDRYALARFALSRVRYMKKHAGEITPALQALARRERLFGEGPSFGLPSHVYGRDLVFEVLANLGEHPESVEIFRDYVKSVSRPEAWLGLSKDALAAQQRALDAAYGALKEWGNPGDTDRDRTGHTGAARDGASVPVEQPM